MWCLAMNVYSRVAKDVEPKKAKLAEANAQMESATVPLNAKRDNLQAVQENVIMLETQLNDALAEKQGLADQATLCEARLFRAGKLTAALGDEQAMFEIDACHVLPEIC